MRRLIEAVVTFAVALAAWQVVVSLTGIPHFILPGPARVAQALTDNAELIAFHAGVTVTEVLAGLVIGSVLGGATAIHLMMSPRARRMFLPVMVFSQAVPVFALAPVLTLWLGYGIASKIVMTVLIIYFPVASTFFDGLSRTDEGLLDLGRTMNATPAQLLFRIRVPSALPSFASGLRLASVYAPIGAVIGEWVGSSNGLGYLMLLANGRAKTDLMFAALFVLAFFTVILYVAISHGAEKLDAWAKGRTIQAGI